MAGSHKGGTPLPHSWGWLKKLLASPPYLPDGYNATDFARFMREETYLYSPRYAKRSVVIHNGQSLGEITRRHGAILAPVHYGSFFLPSGAIVHQLKLPCTDIVTSRNLTVLPAEEESFWRGVHQRSSQLYQQPLFHSGITSPRVLMQYLTAPNKLLLAMLDVREAGSTAKEFPFIFLQQQIYLQTGPARLACLARVPLVPTCIQYNLAERRHHLYFGSPVWPSKSPIDMTQQTITQLEGYVAAQPQQLFHDLIDVFSQPALRQQA